MSRAVTSSYTQAVFSPDEPTLHGIAIFWEFNQKLFAAHLRYVVATIRTVRRLEELFLETMFASIKTARQGGPTLT